MRTALATDAIAVYCPKSGSKREYPDPCMKRIIRLLIPLCACFALGPGYDVTSLAAEDAGSCLYHCEGSTCADFSNHSSMCVELRAKCQARCSGRKWWGAIAYSKKDKAYGWSSGLNDREAAKKEAMQKCVKNGGKGCEWWAIYENECGAVAIDGSITTWGSAYLRKDAQATALLECQKAGGKNCTIQVWACSTM
jgi:hypothetical protein